MTFIFELLVSPENFVPFGQILDLAKDLAWGKKYLVVAQRIWKSKNCFFFAFSLLSLRNKIGDKNFEDAKNAIFQFSNSLSDP